MKIHDLKPAEGSRKRAQARRPRHRRQGRQDRRPWHQGPAGPRHRPRRLRGRPAAPAHAGPQAAGLQQPVPRRVPGRQPRHDRGVRSRRGDPRDAAAPRASSSKGALVKVLGRGELTRAVTVKVHACSALGRRGDHRRGRLLRAPAAALRGASGVPRECPHQPLTGQRPIGTPSARRPRDPADARPDRSASEHPGAPCHESATSSRCRTCATRSCSPCAMLVLYRFGLVPAGARCRPERGPGHRGPGPRGRRARATCSCSRAGAHPVQPLRAGHHAVHHQLDHHADPDGGDPEAPGVAAAGRGRPAQDHPVDPLPDHRHRGAAGDRASPSCSTTVAAGLHRQHQHQPGPDLEPAAGDAHRGDLHRRHGAADVDGRADHQPRHRQRHVAHHLLLGRLGHARCVLGGLRRRERHREAARSSSPSSW